MKKTIHPEFLGRIPVRTELPVISDGKEIGWKVWENVGIGVINSWLLVPEPIRSRLLFINRFSVYLFFLTSPVVESGKYTGWKIKFHNPIRTYLDQRAYIRKHKGTYFG